MSKMPQRLKDLEECRRIIIGYIAEIQKIADSASKELRTLQAALEHIDKQIEEFKQALKKDGGTSPEGGTKSAA